jgi:hypothetical protein
MRAGNVGFGSPGVLTTGVPTRLGLVGVTVTIHDLAP